MKAETISDQPYVVLSLWHGRGELGEIDPGLLLHTQVCGRLYKVHRVQANLQAQQMRTSPLNLLFSSFLTPAQSFISYPPLFASSFQLNVPAVFSVDPNAVMPRKMLFGLCFFHALIQEPDTIFMQSCIRIGRTPIRPNGCWSIFTFSSHRTARGWPPSSPLNLSLIHI